MVTSIRKWGNSQGILLPKHLLRSLRWSEDEQITVAVQDGKLVIERTAPSEQPTIEELFSGWKGDPDPREVDWGEPAGKEIW